MAVWPPANPALAGKIPPPPPFVKGGLGGFEAHFLPKISHIWFWHRYPILFYQKKENDKRFVAGSERGLHIFPQGVPAIC